MAESGVTYPRPDEDICSQGTVAEGGATNVVGLGIEAVISVGIGLALLGERLTGSQTAGIAIILVGLATLKHG